MKKPNFLLRRFYKIKHINMKEHRNKRKVIHLSERNSLCDIKSMHEQDGRIWALQTHFPRDTPTNGNTSQGLQTKRRGIIELQQDSVKENVH